jgi:tetratricopeptide (TPR) repeat protein
MYRIILLFLIPSSVWAQEGGSYIEHLEKHLESCTVPTEEIAALIDLANACRVYDIHKSQFYIEKAMELSLQEKDTNGLCNTHFSKGLYLLAVSEDEPAAMKEFNTARLLAKEFGKDTSSMMYIESNILMNLGAYYYSKGALGKSLQYQLDAVDLCVKNRDTASLSSIYINIGVIYDYVGYYEAAIDFFYTGRKLSEDQNQVSNYATYNANLALTYTNLGDYTTAKALINEAQDIFIAIDDRGGLANCHGVKAMIGLEENDLEKVSVHTDSAFQIFANLSSTYGMLYVRRQQTEVAIRERNYLQALEWAEKGLLASQENETESEQIEWYQLLIDIYSKTQNSKQLAKIILPYIHLRDSFEQKKTLQMLAITQVKFDVEKLKREKELLSLKTIYQRKDLEVNALEMKQQNTIIFLLIAFLFILGVLVFLLTRQARLQTKYKLLSLRQQLLQSQINPHFFFNVLNALQSSILNEKPIVAYNHHGKFAKLMRFTLNMSSEPTVLFQDELYALRLFIELEQMRTDNEFDFDIEINSSINQSNTKVPGMLLQPFIENAIWHGIIPCKDRKGHLKISFGQQKGQLLQCIIEDNGIGRDRARENKQKRSHVYKSKGLSITQNRLKLYGALYKDAFKFEIEDLKDASGRAKGTRIVVQIPIFSLTPDK